MKKAPLIVAGIIFALVALAHLARIGFQIPLVVGTTEVPYTVNIVGFIISALLSYWMFCSSKRR
jgi:hypothetical protein